MNGMQGHCQGAGNEKQFERIEQLQHELELKDKLIVSLMQDNAALERRLKEDCTELEDVIAPDRDHAARLERELAQTQELMKMQHRLILMFHTAIESKK